MAGNSQLEPFKPNAAVDPKVINARIMIGNCLCFVFGSAVYLPPQSGHNRYGFKLYWDNSLLPRISLSQIGQFIFGGMVLSSHLTPWAGAWRMPRPADEVSSLPQLVMRQFHTLPALGHLRVSLSECTLVLRRPPAPQIMEFLHQEALEYA